MEGLDEYYLPTEALYLGIAGLAIHVIQVVRNDGATFFVILQLFDEAIIEVWSVAKNALLIVEDVDGVLH